MSTNVTSPFLVFAPEVELLGRTAITGVLTRNSRPDQDQGTDLERLVEAAGRECYDSYGVGRSSEGFHEHIAEVGHGSVLRHVSWTFRIAGVSRGLTHELIRHAAGVGISQRSTRYCDEAEHRIVVPPAYIVCNGDSIGTVAAKRFAQLLLLDQRTQAVRAYKALLDLDLGLNRKQARGAARSVLGTDMETSLIWTANAQAMTTILSQRWTEHAEAEIHRLAGVLLDFAQRDLPIYFSPVDGKVRRL